jgi:hypothetical protein
MKKNNLSKTIKDLEKIIVIQERTIVAERTVSNNILDRFLNQEFEIYDLKSANRFLKWRVEYLEKGGASE